MSRPIPLRMLCLLVLAMVGVAFASATAVRGVPSAGEVRLEAFLLSGGSVADLCRHDQDGHEQVLHCALCHLVAGTDLPSADPPPIAIERRVLASIILPQVRRAGLRPKNPATPLRGPPAREG
ncbi:hypothetical protein [Paracoccus beibuensis]|uniref:hypothetical protein n=1 Tax=Paracoccus beibuensis TaxID=547602 RepID=UPI0022401E03|nr:hypothetical protein [Paracoccus beibuensis]